MAITVGQANTEASVFGLVDDWLKRDRFVFIGWSELLLFPCAFLALDWMVNRYLLLHGIHMD